MSGLTLVIANKNYSSWSLRPWIMLRQAGIPFKEVMLRFDTPEFKPGVLAYSSAGQVPVLQHGAVTVWESLAILEYLAETFPDTHIWPADAAARAMARSVASEMHAGFGHLRSACPMNLRRPPNPVPVDARVLANVARLESLWAEARTAFGGGGPFLFGRFCAADAMFAPAVTRLDTFAFTVSPATRRYMDAVLGTDAFQAWKADALKEPWIVPDDEVD